MRNATPVFVLPFKMRRPTRRHYFFVRTTHAKINPGYMYLLVSEAICIFPSGINKFKTVV